METAKEIEKAKEIVREAVDEYSDKCEFTEVAHFENGKVALLVDGEFDREGYYVNVTSGVVEECVIMNGETLSDWVEN